MRLQLKEDYLGFPAGTIIENVSLVSSPHFMGKVTVLDMDDSSGEDIALNEAFGAKADESATTDTGTFSLISLIKRASQGITTIFTRQTDGSQKTQVVDQNGRPLRNPDHVDCTSTVNVVYRGFNIDQGTTLLVNKVDMTDTTNITRTWGTGTWVNRSSIIYS